MSKVINIVGKGTGWENAPYEGEVWGATQLILYRWVSRLIDMNDYSDDKWGLDKTFLAKQAEEKATKDNIPVTDLDNYPIDEIVKYFGTDFFSNTIDYMIALAIYEGATEINIYGCSMETSEEYQYQRPGLHFWIGQAMGRGIKVRIMGKRCNLLKVDNSRTTIWLKATNGLMYGYETAQTIDREK